MSRLEIGNTISNLFGSASDGAADKKEEAATEKNSTDVIWQ